MTFSELLTSGYVTAEIDDIGWQTELATNPAQFYRAKSQYVIAAVPRFSRPPEMKDWLAYTDPDYDDYLYTAPEEKTAPVTIETEMEDFELCSVGLLTTDIGGNTTYTPVTDFTYDSVTGDVVLNSTSLSEGDRVDIDFYSDGTFTNALNGEIWSILGLCVAFIWQEHFNNSFLNQTPKVKDRTFDTGSESAHTTAMENKLKGMRGRFNDAMLQLERNLMYRQTMPIGLKITMPT
jgi:hypothetical protein